MTLRAVVIALTAGRHGSNYHAGMPHRLLFAAIALVGLLGGCTNSVAGRPARPVDVVERALPTAGEIARILGSPVEADTAPQVGGLDSLRDAKDTVTPHECIGVTHAGYRQSYEGATVHDTGRRLWVTPYRSAAHLSAAVAIVELDSAQSARAWYLASVKQWHKCQGMTVTERIARLSFIQTIDQVTDSNATLAAKIGLSTDAQLVSPGMNWRALTATSRYLVDVEVFRIGKDSGSADPDPTAIARSVVDKIADLR